MTFPVFYKEKSKNFAPYFLCISCFDPYQVPKNMDAAQPLKDGWGGGK